VDFVIRDENCLYRRSHPFTAFETIQNNVRFCVNNTEEDYKIYTIKINHLVIMSN
jgi:hypothetical protein